MTMDLQATEWKMVSGQTQPLYSALNPVTMLSIYIASLASFPGSMLRNTNIEVVQMWSLGTRLWLHFTLCWTVKPCSSFIVLMAQ